MANLLVITQKVDKEDDLLGFFHGWIKEFSRHYDNIIVVCLYKGSYDLPPNVKVLSLGKEEGGDYGQKIWRYLTRFYKYIWQEKNNYDRVFVHMNKEYVVLGGLFWHAWHKPISLWYNHRYGNIFSRIAGQLANNIFYTSPHSFFAKYKKAKPMPVGIDTEIFRPIPEIEKIPNSILFLGRISPVKKLEVLIKAAKLLKESGREFVVNIYGAPGETDKDYYESILNLVKEYGLDDRINFKGSVPNYETPKIFNQHEIFVNLTDSGSMDKTIFEALACGTIPLVSNRSFNQIFTSEIAVHLIFKQDDAADLAEKTINIINDLEKDFLQKLKPVIDRSSLANLGNLLKRYLHASEI